MKRPLWLRAGLFVLLLPILLSSCGELIIAGTERVTFELVIDDGDGSYNLLNKTVYAEIHDHNADGALIERVEANFTEYPNNSYVLRAQFTTLEEIQTNRRYFLEFYVDMDDTNTPSTGDFEGFAIFEVIPNAVATSASVYKIELSTII